MKATALYRPLASLACRMPGRNHYLDVEAKLRKEEGLRAGAGRAAPHHPWPSFCSPRNLDVPMVVTEALNIPQRTLGNNRNLQQQPKCPDPKLFRRAPSLRGGRGCQGFSAQALAGSRLPLSQVWSAWLGRRASSRVPFKASPGRGKGLKTPV